VHLPPLPHTPKDLAEHAMNYIQQLGSKLMEEELCYKPTWSPCGRFYGLGGKGNILCPWFKVSPLYFWEEELRVFYIQNISRNRQ
jgi:hypothetical protein